MASKNDNTGSSTSSVPDLEVNMLRRSTRKHKAPVTRIDNAAAAVFRTTAYTSVTSADEIIYSRTNPQPIYTIAQRQTSAVPTRPTQSPNTSVAASQAGMASKNNDTGSSTSSVPDLEGMASKNDDTGSSTSSVPDLEAENEEKHCDPNQLTRMLNTGSERKEMAMLIMDTECNWEHLLLPAPTSIAILGQLMCIATKKDFSLTNRTPKDGFKLCKHPDSFRACLMQVSNTGCAAFICAHKNMVKIGLYSAQFQQSIKQCVTILLRGTDDDKCKILPIVFEEMKKDSESCLRIAKETEKKFDEVILLIDEIAESSAAVKDVYQEGLKETLAQLENYKSRQKELADRKKDVDNEKKEIIEQVEKAKMSYEKSLEEVPGPGKVFWMNVGESAVKAVSGMVQILSLSKLSNMSAAFVSVSQCLQSKGKESEPNRSEGSRPNDQPVTPDSRQKESLAKAYEHISAIRKSTDKLYELFVETGNTGENSKYSICLGTKEESPIMHEKVQLVRIKREYENCQSTEHPTVASAIKLTSQCVAVCDEMTEMCNFMDSSSFDHLFNKVKNLRDKAREMEIEASAVNGGSSFTLPTNAQNDQSHTPQKKKRAAEIASENARYIVEERKWNMNVLRERQRHVEDELNALREKQDNVLKFLSEQDIEKINFEEIQITMKEGLLALADLKDQWSLMVLFFSKVSQTIDVCIDQKTFRISDRLQAGDYMVGEVTRDIVLRMASEINAVTYSLRLIAETYTSISEKHLVPKTAALGRLIAFDPKTEGKELDRERQKLDQDCIEAKEEITRLAVESRQKAALVIDGANARLCSEIEKKLPSISEERLTQIKKNVQRAHQANTTEEDYI